MEEKMKLSYLKYRSLAMNRDFEGLIHFLSCFSLYFPW